jgi:hypothetical protein
MLRSFYAYTRVYIPFVLVFLVLLGGVFVYKQINPDVTLAQRWQNIENKWSPQQSAALDALSNDFDNFDKTVVDYRDLKTAIAGWTNDLGLAKDWAPATTQVQALLDDSSTYVGALTQAGAAASSTDVSALSQTLVSESQTFATEVATVRLALGLKAVNQATASPGASGASPSAAPSGSGSAAPSVSATPSGSGSAVPIGSASATASASASASPTPS